MWTRLVGLCLLTLALRTAAADPNAPAVVELFTSQGCSSCPPAEAVLAKLGNRADVIALAYHVTYWDDLVWKDRLGLPEADARQSQYARALGLASVYTPQAVINGRVDRVGSDANKLNASLRQQPPALIDLKLTDGALQLSLPNLGHCDCDLLLIGVLPQTQTAVGRGENAGRVIQESNVVRSITRVGVWNGSAATRTEQIKQVAEDARALVLLAQERSTRGIVAAGKVDMR
jgi:hypothetical protein